MRRQAVLSSDAAKRTPATVSSGSTPGTGGVGQLTASSGHWALGTDGTIADIRWKS